MKMIRTTLCAWIALTVSGAHAASIVGSKHDLSVHGGASVKAATEGDICIFCHTPHNSSTEAPLWNRYSSKTYYTPYASSTLKAEVGQPTGASKLCLSCHDGTVALGMVRSRANPITMAGGVGKMPRGRANLGSDLSDDHPVSFTYDATLVAKNKELRNPTSRTAAARPDRSGQVQCTSCHDPHDNQYGNFMVMDNNQSALCLTCHDKAYWSNSDHRTSTKKWNGHGQDPWPHTEGATVAANGCENCHAPHAAGTPARLMNFAGEEQNCLPCHNGNVASMNIQAELSKASRHDVTAQGGTYDTTRRNSSDASRVECIDCHNPHAARGGTVKAASASGAGLAGNLLGVAGVSASGTTLPAANNEYEICFRCHENRAAGKTSAITRKSHASSLRLQFSPGNASYHPVVTSGRNPDVPSLLNAYTTASIIKCTDCHNNDQGPSAGGQGPGGPHGSIYKPLLERKLVTADFREESPSAYALCYKCHNRNSILDNESFPEHRRHIVDEKTACTTCHDSHGVSGSPALINFNKEYVSAGSAGLVFQHTGRFQGSCSLTCHGTTHTEQTYGSPAFPAAAKGTRRRR